MRRVRSRTSSQCASGEAQQWPGPATAKSLVQPLEVLMKASPFVGLSSRLSILAATACIALAVPTLAQQVTFAPYIQLGDSGSFGFADQVVVAWQTNESTPNASAYRVEIR